MTAPGALVFAEPGPNARAWEALRGALREAWVEVLGEADVATATIERWEVNPSSARVLDVMHPFERLRLRLRVDSEGLAQDEQNARRLAAAWGQRLKALGATEVADSPAWGARWDFDAQLLARLQEAQLQSGTEGLSRKGASLRV